MGRRRWVAGPIYANRRAAIVIALVGLVLAVVAGVLLSTSIARSLGGATRTLDRIARFELEAPAMPRMGHKSNVQPRDRSAMVPDAG